MIEEATKQGIESRTFAYDNKEPVITYWFTEEGITFICDYNKLDKTNDTGRGRLFVDSLLVQCSYKNGEYTVDEVIPLKMQ